MKDLSLSLLSRGCGRFVSSNRKTGRYDGRLDVCFTPQDYYIWKSQDSFLQLSNSGHLRVEAESTLPKTYSTRRGPLLLYSKDLVTMETSCHSDTRDRKKCAVQRYTQQLEQQLSTLKELTAAILNYSTQLTYSRLGATSFPPFHLPLAPDLHRPNPSLIPTTEEQSNPELLVQLNPQWVAAERNTEQLKNQPEDKEGEVCNKKRVRLDLFLQIPSTCTTPPPQMEPQPWLHYVGVSPEEDPQAYLDTSQQHTENSGQIETSHQDIEAEHHHPNMICVRGASEDQGCSIQDTTTSDEGNNERSMSVNRHGRTGLLPPLTLGHSVCHGLFEKTDRPRWEGPSNDGHHEHHLPPIEESPIVIPGEAIRAQIQRDAQPKAERVGYQSQENLNRVSSQLHQLPMVFPRKEDNGINGKQQGGAKIERRYSNKETVGQGGGRSRGGGGAGAGGGARLPSEKSSIIQLEPGEEPPPPVGVLGCVAGRKGPGKQTSLAFLQNQLLDVKDPCESTEANRGVVRGILPLELRDLQNDKSVGSLILGPDGEIIQLSLHDNSQEPPQGTSDTPQQALQVLSAEGEKLPWVIVLQPEHTHSEGGVDLNTDVPVKDQHDQSKHKLLDPHRSTETNACSPSSHTDPGKPPVAVTKKKTKTTETETKAWKRPKRDAKNNIRIPPLREHVGKEEQNGGNTEAKEEGEEEELGNTGRTSHLSGSHQPGELQFKDDSSCSEQKIKPNEATTKDAVDKKRKNTKREDAEEAAITTGKRDLTSSESDGQTSKMRKEGRSQRQKTGSDTQSTKRQKQEERTDREAEKSQDNAVLSSVKKKVTDREGVREEVKINEEKKEERAEVASQREESAGGRRRRKGRLKHKDLVVGNTEEPLAKEEVDINHQIKESSNLKSTKRQSTTHSDKTKPNSEEDTDTDHLSTKADKHSSIRSVSSLRSTAATSQFNHRSLRRSAASSCEGSVPTSAMGLTSSCGRLSSCSTVMIREEQLMLNPVKPESSRLRKRQEQQEEAVALHLAQRAEQRRQEVERKRKKQEEEERKQQEREQTEERMKSELEEERMKRTEELRLKRLAEEEEQRKRVEEMQERARREQAQREREKRRQEEKRRQMERLQRLREEEEQRKKDELERLRLEDDRRQEEENKKLQEMDESERIEYLCRKKQEEEEDRKNKEQEHKRIEEAALQAAEEKRLQTELLTRQMALLQQQLAFKRGLVLEAEGLEKTQGISRPWIYSYFTLLQLLGLNPTKAEPKTS